MKRRVRQRTQAIPSPDREIPLELWARRGEKAVEDYIVSSNLNLVRFIAGKFTNKGELFDDLVGVGEQALLNAVRRFDPSRGTKFSTYAAPTIVGTIQRHFRDKVWHIKVPRRLKELNLEISKIHDKLVQRYSRNPTVDEIAAELEVSSEEVLAALEVGNAYSPISLDEKLESDGDNASSSNFLEYLGEDDADINRISDYADLEEALEKLRRIDPRLREVVRLHFFEGKNQTETGLHMRISQMHVSRLKGRALEILKRELTPKLVASTSAEN